jgi:hypothetical protein
VLPSNEEWSRKRKTMMAAFYKDKLIKITEIMKEVSFRVASDWEKRYANFGEPIDIVEEVNNVFVRNILNVCFGEDVGEYTMTFEDAG